MWGDLKICLSRVLGRRYVLCIAVHTSSGKNAQNRLLECCLVQLNIARTCQCHAGMFIPGRCHLTLNWCGILIPHSSLLLPFHDLLAKLIHGGGHPCHRGPDPALACCKVLICCLHSQPADLLAGNYAWAGQSSRICQEYWRVVLIF